MAILSNTNYYYFVTRRGVTTIKKYLFHVTTAYYPSHEQLTDEQVAFYLSNPTATVEEVRNCVLNPPYVPPTPEIETLRANAIIVLKQAYCAAIKVGDLQLAAAGVDFLKQLSPIKLAQVGSTMDNSAAIEVIKAFASSYNASTQIYSDAVAAIQSAVDETEVNERLTAALTAFNSL